MPGKRSQSYTTVINYNITIYFAYVDPSKKGNVRLAYAKKHTTID